MVDLRRPMKWIVHSGFRLEGTDCADKRRAASASLRVGDRAATNRMGIEDAAAAVIQPWMVARCASTTID